LKIQDVLSGEGTQLPHISWLRPPVPFLINWLSDAADRTTDSGGLSYLVNLMFGGLCDPRELTERCQ